MKNVKILIFGAQPPCARCLQAERIAREVAALYPEGLVSVEKLAAWSEQGKKYEITMTPTTIIQGEKAAVGRVLSAEELKGMLDRHIGGHGV
jgi:hypothetical protein